jgi:hypothetical protein
MRTFVLFLSATLFASVAAFVPYIPRGLLHERGICILMAVGEVGRRPGIELLRQETTQQLAIGTRFATCVNSDSDSATSVSKVPVDSAPKSHLPCLREQMQGLHKGKRTDAAEQARLIMRKRASRGPPSLASGQTPAAAMKYSGAVRRYDGDGEQDASAETGRERNHRARAQVR